MARRATEKTGARVKRIAVFALFLIVACHRETSPTVVFEAGLGDTDDSFHAVADRVRKVAPVLLYDRAGLGDMPAASTPRTPSNIARELHDRLTKENVAPPYILVSHSAGAWYALQFASDYRGEVAGLVMIDPTPFHFFDDGVKLLPPEYEQQMRNYEAKASPGRRAEWDARFDAAKEAERANPSRDLPVTIITGAAESPDKPEALRQWWLRQHEEWTHQWIGGRHVVVYAGHYVQSENPDAVVAEIVRIVDSLRSRSSAFRAR